MPINSYGDKVDTVKIGRYEDGKFKYIHIPRIEVNGEMCGIHDETTKSKFVEFDDKKEAIQTAKDALQELKNNNMI
jgi:hypothetical protein